MNDRCGVAVQSVEELPATPWRNGCGLTRPVISASDDEQSAWRISIATVTDGAAFSSFPGYDRIFVPLTTGRITLQQDGSELATDPDGFVRFDGVAKITARVLGGPALAVNVMAIVGHEAHLQWRIVNGDYTNNDPSTRAVILASGSVVTLDGTIISAPAVVWPVTSVRCTGARLLEIRTGS
jgi:environmental stress-induced protein Ves